MTDWKAYREGLLDLFYDLHMESFRAQALPTDDEHDEGVVRRECGVLRDKGLIEGRGMYQLSQRGRRYVERQRTHDVSEWEEFRDELLTHFYDLYMKEPGTWCMPTADRYDEGVVRRELAYLEYEGLLENGNGMFKLTTRGREAVESRAPRV